MSPDIREPRARGRYASALPGCFRRRIILRRFACIDRTLLDERSLRFGVWTPSNPRHHGQHVRAQIVERRTVRFAPGTNSDVGRVGARAQRREQLESRELTQASFEAIAIDGGMLMARNHDTNA